MCWESTSDGGASKFRIPCEVGVGVSRASLWISGEARALGVGGTERLWRVFGERSKSKCARMGGALVVLEDVLEINLA